MHAHVHMHMDTAIKRATVQPETQKTGYEFFVLQKYHPDYQASPMLDFADYQDFLLVLLVMLSMCHKQCI